MSKYSSEGENYVAAWNQVISTSYEMFNATQCHSTGLISNWARVWENGTNLHADANFSGSGTPGAQYGSEASRTTWRVALDYLLYPEESAAEHYLQPVVRMLKTKESHCEWADTLDIDPSCLVTSVHADWQWNMFIAGPTFSSLVCPASSVSARRQQELINAAGARIAKGGISDYYGGSWVAISTATVNGDFIRAASNAGLYSPTTKAASKECSTATENCRNAGCCEDAGYTCFQKDVSWAGCRSSCQPGQNNPLDPPEYQTPWDCQPVSPSI